MTYLKKIRDAFLRVINEDLLQVIMQETQKHMIHFCEKYTP